MPTNIDDYSKHFDPDYELPEPPTPTRLSVPLRLGFAITISIVGVFMLLAGTMGMTAQAQTQVNMFGMTIPYQYAQAALAISGLLWMACAWLIRISAVIPAAVIGALALLVSLVWGIAF